MELSEEQVKLVVDHLKSVAPDGFVCPVCGEKHWSINSIIVETREYINGKSFPKEGISLMPFVTLRCSRCFNTFFFNAITLGIVSRFVEDDEKKQPQGEPELPNKLEDDKKEENHG